MRTNLAIKDSKIIKITINRIRTIFDAEYKKANLKEIKTKL